MKPGKRYLFAALGAIALFAGSNLAQAQSTLAGWDFSGYSGYGSSPASPNTTASNITVGGLTRGSGVGTSGTAASNAWGGVGWDSTSLNNAVTANDFATFSVTASSGYTVSFTSIEAYNVRRSGTGPTTGQWQYRIGSGSFTNIGSAITWGSTTSAAGNAQSAIDLSGITALQNVAAGTTVTFRVVNWGGASTGTWYLNNFGITGSEDFVVQGTVNSAGPPPTTNNSVVSVPANAAFGRVMSGSTQTVAVTNSGSNSTTFSASTSGGFTSAATGAVGGNGSASLPVGVGSTLGERTGALTVTNTATANSGAGTGNLQNPVTSELSATVVQNRQVGRGTVAGVPDITVTENVIDVGAVLVNTVATGSGVITTIGADNENTRVTVNGNQTVNFSNSDVSLNLFTAESAVQFNSDSSTMNVTGEAQYATSGLKTSNFANLTAVGGALTGEGLAGESVQTGRVYFRADVYQAANLDYNNATPLDSNDTIIVNNAATSDGGQRATAEITSRSVTGAGWSVTGLATGTTINQDSTVSGTVNFNASASGLLNGSTSSGSLQLGFQHANQSMQGASSNDLGDATWNFETIVTGNNSGSGSATINNGGSFAGLGIQSSTGLAQLLDGTSGGNRTLAMELSSTPIGMGVSANPLAISQYLSLTGTESDVFTLSLNYNGTATDPVIQWWDGSSWVNAVLGNTGGTANFIGDTPYDAAIHFSLGNYGFDSTTNTAWAVLNHNSEFVVVPEPGTWFLVSVGLGALAIRRRIGLLNKIS